MYAHNYHLARRYLKINLQNNDIIELPFINAFGLKLTEQNLFRIASIDAVKYVSSASNVAALMYRSNEFLGTTDKVVLNKFNSTIAVIDTGVSPHIDLMIPNKIIKFVDMVNDKLTLYDDNGHGTFVTGVLCSNGTYSGGKYQGVDINTSVVVIKALDKNGETGALNILNSMQWIYDNKNNYNIKVVCMSFGSVPIGENDPLIKGAEVLWDNGIVVVCAAGNSGPSEATIKSPGASTKIITVGALDLDTMRVANFSSRGPIYDNFKPDLIAPGVNVRGLNYKLTKGKPYTTMSGTSVATPMVAGLCSMILRDNPNLSPNDVKAKLISMCTPITGNRNEEGFGYYDKNKN